MDKILKMVAQRLALGLLTMFVVSLIIFFAVNMLPGDVCQEILGQSQTPETVAACRRELKLDLPWYDRYFTWLVGILQGDMGRSLASQREISELIGVRLGNTLFLALVAAIMSVPVALVLGVLAALYRNSLFDRTINALTLTSISFPEFFVAYILILFLALVAAIMSVPVALVLGVLAALYRNSLFDRTINALTLTSISFPEFFVAYILILFLAVNWGWFPSISNISPDLSIWERVYRTSLPALTLTLVVIAHMMRMTRASIINLLASPYIEMANLKGLSRSHIIVHHALPNALAPIINVVVINLAYLVVGVVIAEVVFVYPGLGQLLVDSVSKRDIPVVQASCMIFAATYILLNLTADVLAIATNPRLMHPR
jgi:peptide/nickel transport system permease protein